MFSASEDSAKSLFGNPLVVAIYQSRRLRQCGPVSASQFATYSGPECISTYSTDSNMVQLTPNPKESAKTMQNLTPAGKNIVNDIATRYNLSVDAVMHMLIAVNNGGGTMAQFNSPELGGSGQWMRGGMTMVGNMFDHGLQARVDSLCNELSGALMQHQIFPVVPAGTTGSNQWWPQDLGVPFSSGAQNNIRYAIFPQRLAVEQNGNIVVYDTLDHQIGGVSQQQGGDTSLSFSSQYGTISINSLPVISGDVPPPSPQTNFANSTVGSAHEETHPAPSQVSSSDDIFQMLEKLAHLRDAGVLSADEFENKKRELMSRI